MTPNLSFLKNSPFSKIFFIALTHGMIVSSIFNIIGIPLFISILAISIIGGGGGFFVGICFIGPIIGLSFSLIPYFLRTIIFFIPFTIASILDFIFGFNISHKLDKKIQKSTRFLTDSRLYRKIFPENTNESNSVAMKCWLITACIVAFIGVVLGILDVADSSTKDNPLFWITAISVIGFTIASLVITKKLSSFLKASYVEIKNRKNDRNTLLFLSIFIYPFSLILGFSLLDIFHNVLINKLLTLTGAITALTSLFLYLKIKKRNNDNLSRQGS